MLRAIAFDAVGTLIHPAPPAWEVYAAFGRQFGSHHPAEVVRSRFLAAFAREESADAATGYFADLVLFDAAKIVDRATTAAPTVPSDGIHTVIVNGRVVFKDGKSTQIYTGRILRQR